MTGANVLNLLSEINFSRIRMEAERRFSLLIAGEKELATALARALSQDSGKEGMHPWLEVQEFSHEPHHHDLAFIVSREADLDEAATAMMRRLNAANVPTVVVVVSDAAKTQVGAELPRPLEDDRALLPTSLSQDVLCESLVPAMVRVASPGLKLVLARHLPLLRTAVAHDLIEEASRANALYTASTGLVKVVPLLNLPLNVADIVVLSKNQLVMAYKIALALGKQGEPKDVMAEIVGVIGGGLLFRQVARGLVGLIPAIGIVPNVAVAYAGTKVIGHSVYLWAAKGERLSKRDMRRLYLQALSKGRELAKKLVASLRRREPPALPAPKETSELSSSPGKFG